MVQKRYFKKLLKSIIVKNVFIMTNIWFELLFFPCLVTPLINFFNINMFPVWISSKSYTFSPFCWVKYVFKKKKKKLLPFRPLIDWWSRGSQNCQYRCFLLPWGSLWVLPRTKWYTSRCCRWRLSSFDEKSAK